ncbi:uncharacterized protein BO72DRAFT_447214 [Aspergillus fijiensis CBS 313.89]|uniref:Secreted protein n=1 Tax=Aspergillus fijiensis CBS 313.89 TaxID=1448319 RepID=A0A8G1RRV9_9EURO|nr:uncharacterized protein BO72DRAFT_447214 [Aspergillus fijiensis CBS 313.89]RAK78144.1 hypothetical protein BO72DRAFT_447214 [Aspergillus fijiensis CBS 313.89]
MGVLGLFSSSCTVLVSAAWLLRMKCRCGVRIESGGGEDHDGVIQLANSSCEVGRQACLAHGQEEQLGLVK